MEEPYHIQNLLSYEEMARMRKDPKFKQKIMKSEFRKLLDRITKEHIKLETTKVDVAYRIELEVMDDMNIVGKITSIPIMDVVLKHPKVEMSMPKYTLRKFTLKERIKILLKGEL